VSKGGATNLKVGGESINLEGWEVSTVKTLNFEKGRGCPIVKICKRWEVPSSGGSRGELGGALGAPPPKL